MAENSKIQWTHHTFNPWRGCSKVHAGCANCYAETLSGRNPKTLGTWGPNGTRVVAAESAWREPLKWNRDAEKAGERRRVFCASLADVFEDWAGVIHDAAGNTAEHDEGSYSAAYGDRFVRMNDLRSRLFDLIDATPCLDWLLLTKRPENVRRFWKAVEVQSQSQADDRNERGELYRRNVWLGTSVSDQATADNAIPHLLTLRDLSPVLFLSVEPLIGLTDLWVYLLTTSCPRCGTTIVKAVPTDTSWCSDCCVAECNSASAERRGVDHDGTFPTKSAIDWVIVGGESGGGARTCEIGWIRSILTQCRMADVPCFVKQLGAHPSLHEVQSAAEVLFPDGVPPGAKVVGTLERHLVDFLVDPKGGDPAEWPADLRVRQFPQITQGGAK